MTAAPFRELFVELPRALFESLQAIGEAAVERAKGDTTSLLKDLYPAPRLWFAWLEPAARALGEFYGWREVIRTERDPLDHYITLVVRLGCGHRQRYRIDELSMLRADHAASRIDLICDIIERTERPCQCVQRPSPGEPAP